MAITPRIHQVPAINNMTHNETGETNIVAIQAQNPTEPTLLEIIEPDVKFEALSSQL